MMYTLPLRRTGLHPWHSRLTDERVFMPRVCCCAQAVFLDEEKKEERILLLMVVLVVWAEVRSRCELKRRNGEARVVGREKRRLSERGLR